MAGLKMEAAIIFEPFLPNALGRALEYAGNDGFVASMPRGKLPDGTEIPVYPFDEFKQGVADLPMRYGMGGEATLGAMARYVAMAPRGASTSVRNLDFGP